MINPEQMPYLPASKNNHLVLTDSKRSQRKGMDNDDDYYDEVDANGNLVARYHVWHHMSIYPPHNINEGWEKFDLNGQQVAYGKCK